MAKLKTTRSTQDTKHFACVLVAIFGDHPTTKITFQSNPGLNRDVSNTSWIKGSITNLNPLLDFLHKRKYGKILHDSTSPMLDLGIHLPLRVNIWWSLVRLPWGKTCPYTNRWCLQVPCLSSQLFFCKCWLLFLLETHGRGKGRQVPLVCISFQQNVQKMSVCKIRITLLCTVCGNRATEASQNQHATFVRFLKGLGVQG